MYMSTNILTNIQEPPNHLSRSVEAAYGRAVVSQHAAVGANREASHAVRIRQHTSAYVSNRQQPSAYVSIRCRGANSETTHAVSIR